MNLKLLRQILMMSKYLLYGVFLQVFLFTMLMAEEGKAQRESVYDVKLSVEWNNISLSNALKELEQKTHFKFTYNNNMVSEAEKFTINTRGSLGQILKSMSKSANLKFRRINRNIHVGVKERFEKAVQERIEYPLYEKTISGKVTSAEDGAGLPGVNITIQGTTQGVVTDADGNYKMAVPDEGAKLVFSYVGYINQVVDVGNQSIINVELVPDISQLEEIVVTAFGLEKEKKALGYSVTEVAGKEFTESRSVNIGTALSGKVAGVNVSTPASGAAGSSRVIIRGGSSLTGSDQPLYVVNGVPIDNTTAGSAGLWGGNDGGDGLSSINPDDIESISVLKGNAASALYGFRGANGVIIITTKSGKARKGIGVDFNSNFTFDRVNDLTDFQREYGHGSNGQKPSNQASALQNGQSSWGERLDGSSVVQFDGVSRPYSDQGQTLNDFYRTGYTWTNTIGLSGGNENHTYRFSASNLTNDDIVPNSGFNKDAFSANISGKYGKLSSQITGQYTKETATNRPRLSDSPGNANYTTLMISPAITFESLKGTTGKLGAQADGTELQHQGNVFAQNPYWAAYQFSREDVKDRFLGSASLKYDITDWLYVQGRIGTDQFTRTAEGVEAYGTAYKGLGSVNITTLKVREDNLDLFIGLNKDFQNFNVDVLLGGNRMRRKSESVRIGGNDLNIPFFHSVTNVANQTYSYGFSEWGTNAIFGSATISYQNIIFLTATAREDAFSTLSRDDNKVFYPSVSTSFMLSDALPLPEFFTMAKLRVGWAQTGGGSTAPYGLSQTYSLNSNSHANGAVLGNITNRGTVPNAALKPLVSSEIEFGFDVRLLDNRIGIDFTYYDRTTTDDILNTTISQTSGFGSTTINVGEVTNKGIELLINATPVETSNFRWDLSFNMANNKSNVVNLGSDAEGNPIEFLNLQEARTRQERIRNYLGQPAGVIAGYRHKTINGQKVYTDQGFPVRSDDFEILGEGRHPFSAGLNNSFRYKNFNMSFLIDVRSGGSVMSGTNVLAYGFGVHKETLPGRETGLTVTGVNNEGAPLTVNIAPTEVDDYYGQYNNITEYFVYDASFGKLRQFSLGYTFPQSFLDKTPFNTLNLSFVGRNLLLLWSDVPNIDPESAYSNSTGAQGLEFFALPATRNFGFNLSVTF
ncbi:SusC/RagA family TonB-linked outer membrane protein [Fulvivirgaceae bacterium BMA10]|uniref:SusC/RagA family TonB-linked outer membrane protein n=1 Tax=Splendidivirga corallicola TaxID=3051826 RepID=A0ABT8KN33_9BACT|nr:SusC/RagA family TonB-linked outer membrane protein [Fulvivirgaceae bacterium BMA10]